MDKDNVDNNIEDTDHIEIINNIESNKDKTEFEGNIEDKIYNIKNRDDNIQPTNAFRNTISNPFTIAMDMWQNYINTWNNVYKQILFKNSPMNNSEFLFVYWKLNLDKSKENRHI